MSSGQSVSPVDQDGALPRPSDPIAVCLSLTRAISRAQAPDDIYAAALDALEQGLGVTRASILLFDPDGVMRFKAFRGLSESGSAITAFTSWSLVITITLARPRHVDSMT